MSEAMSGRTLGVIGLGVMGEAVALNLLRAGFRLNVYNRTSAKAEPLRAAGATVLATPAAVVSASDVVLLVLADGEATDAVLQRGTAGVGLDVRGTTFVNMATVDPDYSIALGQALDEAGAVYVEAPMSGSRRPAEDGTLVILTAGDGTAIEALDPVFDVIGKATIHCGTVPNALRMKLANNLLLIAMLEAFAEAAHFASGLGLDLEAYFDLILQGPMRNAVFAQKAPQLLSEDFEARAPLKHVLKDLHLVNALAERAGLAVPVSATNHALFHEAAELGLGEQDVMAVIRVLEGRPS